MNMQKIQICLLAIIAVTLIYIAATYTNTNRYVPLNRIHGTLDTRTGNVYIIQESGETRIYGKTFYLYEYGYATIRPELIKSAEHEAFKKFAKKNLGKKEVDWRDYAGTIPQSDKQTPHNKNIVDEIPKGN